MLYENISYTTCHNASITDILKNNPTILHNLTIHDIILKFLYQSELETYLELTDVIFWFLWHYLILSDTILYCMTPSDTIWHYLILLDIIWYCPTLSDTTWHYLILSVTNWYYLALSDTIWHYLILSDTIWYYLILSHPIWYYQTLSETIWYYVGVTKLLLQLFGVLHTYIPPGVE